MSSSIKTRLGREIYLALINLAMVKTSIMGSGLRVEDSEKACCYILIQNNVLNF